jgi:hypothetical protein
MGIFFRRKKRLFEQSADATVVRAVRRDVRSNRVAARRDAASTRRQERAAIAGHRKWIFISIAVIAVVALAFYCIIKFGGMF